MKLTLADDRAQLEKLLHEAKQVQFLQIEQLREQGELKDKEPFLVLNMLDEAGNKGSAIGCYVKDRVWCYVHFADGVHSEGRRETLKLKAIVSLLDIAETKWIPTAKFQTVPQKYVNIESGKTLFTPQSDKSTLADARHETEFIDSQFHPGVG